MNIRSITYCVDPAVPIATERLTQAGKAVTEIRAALESAGYTVQSARLATPPFPRLLPNASVEQCVQFALDLEAACFVNNLDYAALGPARPSDAPVFWEAIPAILGATQNIFASALIAEPTSGISLPATRRAAEVIQRNASIGADGFGNLRFAALANVPPGTAFFPAAYHDGGTPMFSIGVEAAEVAVSAFAEAASLSDARARLIRAVEDHAQKITKAVKKAMGLRGLRFGGLDFSLAPYPEVARSLGTALERLTGQPTGYASTLAASAFIADSLDRAKFQHIGFSGLFFPIFEDAILAARAAEGQLSLNDMLLYCSVCGTGLDTVPLPGDISVGALASVLVDVAALALRLNKPLTARLMPIPGKHAGDEVKFNFPYFAPTRVLAPRANNLGGFFAGDEAFDLGPRSR
jgi:hypothetical protein